LQFVQTQDVFHSTMHYDGAMHIIRSFKFFLLILRLMRFFAVALIFFGVAASYAQTPEVPHKMHFADMTLTIRDDARREIQKDVDALTQHPRYFGIKVERAKTYFPIIEKIFAEERLPDDFKYLVLQESALISDAVSVSNAVGFWQFKDFTALEMGLRVDKEIDERMNIYSATRGAARYLKKNNYLFNNWLLALQSYQMGGGGVQRSVGDKYNGDRHMEITSETYWYVKKFLAHKIAFENAVIGDPQIKVVQYPIQSTKSLHEIATELAIDEVTLRDYNKWVRADKIPNDRTYSVLVPNGQPIHEFNTLILASTQVAKQEVVSAKAVASSTQKKDINGVMAIRAVAGESTVALADRAGVSLSLLLRYNEIPVDHKVIGGEYYFLKKKKRKSDQHSHPVASSENLWLISQHYGVQLNRLKKLNKFSNPEQLRAGDIVYLNTQSPTRIEPLLEPVLTEESIVVVDDDSFFGWEVKPGEEIIKSRDSVSQNPKAIVKPIIQSLFTDAPNPILLGQHVVTQGETLYSIAKIYGVNVTDLLAWNSLDINAGLRTGQYLKVKSPEQMGGYENESISNQSKDSIFIEYEVKPTDTLYSVARQYNVTIKELMDWNHKQDFNLALGEKLKILTR
jgi:membrane-bound lytic murein transglycosylase D